MSPTLLAQTYFGVNFKVNYVLVTLTPLSRIMNGWEYTAVRLEEKAMNGGGGTSVFHSKTNLVSTGSNSAMFFAYPFRTKFAREISEQILS